MKLTERFDRLIPLIAQRQALKAQLKAVEAEMDDDATYVKEWFRERPNKRRYRGIAYSSVEYQDIDPKKARRLLGAKAKQAEVTRRRETLSLDEESKAVRDHGRLRPVPRAERKTA